MFTLPPPEIERCATHSLKIAYIVKTFRNRFWVQNDIHVKRQFYQHRPQIAKKIFPVINVEKDVMENGVTLCCMSNSQDGLSRHCLAKQCTGAEAWEEQPHLVVVVVVVVGVVLVVEVVSSTSTSTLKFTLPPTTSPQNLRTLTPNLK